MGDFWERKIKSYFDHVDFNKDGTITFDDCHLIADGFIMAEKATGDRKAEITTAVLDFYKILTSASGSEKIETPLTQSVFVELLGKLKNTPKLTTIFENLAAIAFSVLDSNHDGYIDETEYVRFLAIFGVPDPTGAAKTAIDELDANADGLISSSEFLRAFLDYFGSDDAEGPGKHFFGPLLY